MRSIASSSLTVKGVNSMFEKLSRFVGRDPLLASLRGFTPLPSGLSVFRSDARTSSFSASPRLRHHSSGPGGLGSGGTIGIFLPTPAPLHSLLVVALALYLFRLPIVAVEA